MKQCLLNITGMMPSNSQQPWLLVEGLPLSTPVSIPVWEGEAHEAPPPPKMIMTVDGFWERKNVLSMGKFTIFHG